VDLWNVGDKSEAICEACAAIVPTTFQVRAVTLDGAPRPIDDVLVAVCDRCGATVGIPSQSAPRLQEGLRREPAKLAARVNRKLEDALRLIAAEFNVRDSDFRALVIKYYLTHVAQRPEVAKRVRELAHGDLTSGRKTGRIEIRLPQEMLNEAWRQARLAGVRSQTELVEGVIALAAEDILRGRAPRRYRELQQVAVLA
jgi:hypothetical protein